MSDRISEGNAVVDELLRDTVVQACEQRLAVERDEWRDGEYVERQRVARLTAERDAAQALGAMVARKYTEQLEQGAALEAERDALASRLAAAEAALRWGDGLEAWVTHALGIAEDRRIPSIDMLRDGREILDAFSSALAGSREQATTEGE